MPRPAWGIGPVGAMGTLGNQMPDRFDEPAFKPYVYRGWGFDILEEGNIPEPRRFIRPDDVPEVDVVREWLIEEYRAEHERQRVLHVKRERKRRKAELKAERDIEKRRLYVVPPPNRSWYWVDPRTPVSRNVSEPSDTKPEFRVVRRPSKLRPSPGWKPLSGDDLAELLEDLD